MRRGVGVSAIKARNDTNKQYQAIGKAMEETKISNVKEVLDTFRNSLISFAEKHRQNINSDPVFRAQFHSMCISAGVGKLINLVLVFIVSVVELIGCYS